MERTYWHKQTAAKLLFDDLLWSRPENRATAGKLLIIGGSAPSFAAPAEAYAQAVQAGIGTTRVLLPDCLQKTVSKVFEAGEFSASTPTGSFARQSLSEWLALASWADAVLVPGDLGRNSETAIVLEQFIGKFNGQLTLTKDAVDYFTKTPDQILKRPATTLVFSLAQLQQLVRAARFEQAITFGMDLLHLVDFLHEFTQRYPINIVVKHLENIFVAVGEQVSSTKLAEDIEIWQVTTATHCAVWQLQNPTKPFEALSCAIHSANAQK